MGELFTSGTFWFQIVSFLILFYFLNKYAFGPIFGIMEKRTQHIQDQLNASEKNRAESEKLLAEQRELLQKARQDAQEIVEEARARSSRQADEIIAQGKEEAGRLRDQAVADIQQERDKALASLREQVGTLSVLLASKIIEKEIDAKEQEKLIDQYLREVGDQI